MGRDDTRDVSCYVVRAGKACWDKEVDVKAKTRTTSLQCCGVELLFRGEMRSVTHENRLSPFRILLFDFSEELTRRDVEKMKYLASDFIPRGRAEDIQNGLHLFDALERNARISPQNLDLLEEMLVKIGREDLRSKVDKFRQGRCTPFLVASSFGDLSNDLEYYLYDRAPSKKPTSENEVYFDNSVEEQSADSYPAEI